jgi:CheY-like chemotaxis protein
VGDGDLILVADDEAYIVRALSFVLSKAGYRVITAADGAEALDRIAGERPRVAFVDIMMPKLDGYEVCRRVKSDPALSDTHIVIVTAKGQRDDQTRGMALGADEYITKPFSPTAVLKLVRRALEE